MMKRTICDEIKRAYKTYLQNAKKGTEHELDEVFEFIFISANKMNKRLIFYKINRGNDLQYIQPQKETEWESFCLKTIRDVKHESTTDA